MLHVPTDPGVAVLPDIEITVGSLEVYVQSPGEELVGGTKVNAASPNCLETTLKDPS